jgi:SAM-dependent methyltransferase
MSGVSATATHWNQVYSHGDTTWSWFQARPSLSLRMLDRSGVSPALSVIDVGGGASTLVDSLLSRGYRDITVLDVSIAGLHIAQQRLGPAAELVHWLAADLLTWRPARTWDVWHDRAVLHFLTSHSAREQSMRVLQAATRPAAIAVFATFARDGPQSCSGLPVTRYSTRDLADLLGASWQVIATDREGHITPDGSIQPFTWAAFRQHT